MLDDNILLKKYYFIEYHYLFLYLNKFHNQNKYILDKQNCYLYEDIFSCNYFINKYKTKNINEIRKIIYINKRLRYNRNYIETSCIFTYYQIKQNIYKHIYKSYPHIKNDDITIYYLMEINKLSNKFILETYEKSYDLSDIKLILSQLLLYQLDIFYNHGIIINSIKLNNIFINKYDCGLIKYNILNKEYILYNKYIYQINDYSKSIIYNNTLYYNKSIYDDNLLNNIYRTFILMFNLFKFDYELEFYKNILNNQEYNKTPLYSYGTCDLFCKKFLKLYYNNKIQYNDFIKKTLNMIINYINIIWSNLFNYELI